MCAVQVFGPSVLCCSKNKEKYRKLTQVFDECKDRYDREASLDVIIRSIRDCKCLLTNLTSNTEIRAAIKDNPVNFIYLDELGND